MKRAPPATAVALRYDGVGAPRLTAKGGGEVANRIVALAKQHDIPLHHDADLVALLSRLDLGMEIPAGLYMAVAKVLAFAYGLSNKAPVAQPSTPDEPVIGPIESW